MRRILLLIVASLGWYCSAALASGVDMPALLQLIDYVGVDYPEAVQDGQVINHAEYEEMEEFSSLIVTSVAALEEGPVRESLAADAARLSQGVVDKIDASDIAAITQSMRQQLMANYPLVLTPRRAPDLARAALLYQAECASCHGVEGRGDGPAGQELDPEPTDFHDAQRARQRSVYGLYNTVTLGVSGTAMVPYGHLSDADRWALAFYVGSLYSEADQLQAGEAAWDREPISTEAAITQSPAELADEYVDGEALAVWLRHHPEQLFAGGPQPLDIAEDQLADSLLLARSGQYREAERAAITAYLEGFELVEAALSNIDGKLMREVERAMMDYRQLLRREAPMDAIESHYRYTQELLEQSREELEGASLSSTVAFTSALIILLREGLEAILVVAAMLAFLIKTGRRDAVVYVHAGWIAALTAGLGTWAVSSYVISISGATREVTEGFTALFAAVILFYVGFWMHRNANAERWNQYLQDKVEQALSRRTLWTLALVSFLAVYREVFETVLFYQALWAQASAGAHRAIWAGGFAAAALLLVITWIVARFGMRLPLRQFFSVSALLLIALALIFTGKGIAALQEAGQLPHDSIAGPTITWLGIYPNVQGLAVQGGLLLVALALLWSQRRAVEAEK